MSQAHVKDRMRIVAALEITSETVAHTKRAPDELAESAGIELLEARRAIVEAFQALQRARSEMNLPCDERLASR